MREWPADIAAKIVYNIGNRKNHIILFSTGIFFKIQPIITDKMKTNKIITGTEIKTLKFTV